MLVYDSQVSTEKDVAADSAIQDTTFTLQYRDDFLGKAPHR